MSTSTVEDDRTERNRLHEGVMTSRPPPPEESRDTDPGVPPAGCRETWSPVPPAEVDVWAQDEEDET